MTATQSPSCSGEPRSCCSSVDRARSRTPSNRSTWRTSTLVPISCSGRRRSSSQAGPVRSSASSVASRCPDACAGERPAAGPASPRPARPRAPASPRPRASTPPRRRPGATAVRSRPDPATTSGRSRPRCRRFPRPPAGVHDLHLGDQPGEAPTRPDRCGRHPRAFPRGRSSTLGAAHRRVGVRRLPKQGVLVGSGRARRGRSR